MMFAFVTNSDNAQKRISTVYCPIDVLSFANTRQ